MVAGVSIHSHDLTIVVDLRSKGAIVCRGVGSAARSRIPNSFYGERTKGRDCRAAETQRIAENALPPSAHPRHHIAVSTLVVQ